MELTIAVQNLAHGGMRINDDASRNRWDDLIVRLAPVEADIVILNEATDFELEDYAKARVRRRARPRPRRHDPLEVRRAHRGPLPHRPPRQAPRLGHQAPAPGRPRLWKRQLESECLPAPLSLGAIHVTPFSPAQDLIEVQMLVCRAYRSGPYAIIAGDFNFPPPYGLPADIDRMLPFNRMNRLIDPRGDDPQPNETVAQALYDGGFHDVAAELHMRTDDDRLLAYTGKTDRIDWIACSQPLREAIVSYQLLDQPEGASDHEGVTAVIDLRKCDLSDPWAYR